MSAILSMSSRKNIDEILKQPNIILPRRSFFQYYFVDQLFVSVVFHIPDAASRCNSSLGL